MAWSMTKSTDWYQEQRRVVAAGLRRAFGILIANRRLAALLAVGTLVGLLSLVGYAAWTRKQEERAATQLFKAVGQLPTDVKTAEDARRQEAAIQALRELGARYPRSAAAAEATLRLGNLYYALENYEEARRIFQAYLAKNPRGLTAFAARLGVGDTYMAERKFDLAAQTYSSIIAEFAHDPLLPEAYLNLAKTHLALGRPQEALRVYDKVAEAYPNTGWAQTARAKARMLRLSRR
jgi:TolA-binding protein